MAHARPANQPPQVSLAPEEGWHCSHLYYRFDRAWLARRDTDQIDAEKRAVAAVLDPQSPDATQRLQTSIVSGLKADFGLMLMDPDPLRIDTVHHCFRQVCQGDSIATTSRDRFVHAFSNMRRVEISG